MKKILSIILIGLFLNLALLNGVSATTTDEENSARNHGPLYVGSKPLERYEQPGFVIGFYDGINWVIDPWTEEPLEPRYLSSLHLLFGWNFGYRDPPIPAPWFFQIGVFASQVSFSRFGSTFIGFFSGTESGFVCGFVDGMCRFSYS